MHPRIEELINHLDHHRQALTDVVAAVPPSGATEKLSDDGWSVAEVLEHLAIVERRITTSIAHEFETARRAGLATETETSSVMGMMNVDRLINRTERLTASEASRPKSVQTVEESWAVLTSARAGLKNTLEAADGLALGAVQFPHPRFGPLNGYQWLLFLGAHERRHTEQIREVVEALKDRAGETRSR